MKRQKKLWILLLALALILTSLPLTSGTQSLAAKKKMTLSKKKLTLQVGKKKKLKIKNKKGTVKWTTSKKKVATVSKKGVVKAKKAGKTTITAKVKYKKKTKKFKCKVTVIKKSIKATPKLPSPTPKTTPKTTQSDTPIVTATSQITPPSPATSSPPATQTPAGDTFPVSGSLSGNSETPAGGERLVFTNKENGRDSDVTTNTDGTYTIQLPKGEYDIFWNGTKVDTITIEKSALTHEIHAENMYPYTGVLSRLGKPWTDCDIDVYGDERISIHSDATTGAFAIYLPKNESFSVWVDNFYIQRFHTGNSDTRIDISCDYIKVSGTIYQRGTTPLSNSAFYVYSEDQWDGDGKTFYTDKNGNYRIYVNKNSDLEIQHDDSGKTIDTFSVKEEDITKDFNIDVTLITGTVKANNGDLLAEHSLYFREADSETRLWTETDENGCYSIALPSGVYTAGFSGDMELEQKITVDQENVVCNLQAPFYKVSGTIKAGANLWKDNGFYFCWEGIDKEDGYWVTTDENGRYSVYIPARNYTVVAEDFSRESGVPLLVEGDMTKDLQFHLYTASGHIYRTEGTEFETDAHIDLHILDPDGEELAYLFPGEKNDYQLYLEKKGTYRVQMQLGWEMKTIDTFEVTGSDTTHDIVCNLYRISGMITGLRDSDLGYLSFYFENGEQMSANCEEPQNGEAAYSIYLPKGTYYAALINEEDKKTEVQVTGDITSLNIAAKATYKVSGTLSHPSGAWGKKRLTFHPHSANGKFADTVSAADGSYTVYLYPDTYTISIENNELETIEVKTKDQTRDLVADYIEISGTLKRDDKPLTNAHLEFRQQDAKPDPLSGPFAFYAFTDNAGKFSAYVKPSAIYEIYFNQLLLDTITVEREDVLDKALTTDLTNLSGKVTTKNGDKLPNISLFFHEKDSDSEISTVTDWDGCYSLYLAPGTYEVKHNGMVIQKNLTVESEDLVTDIEADLHQVSGTTSKTGLEIRVFDSNQNIITSFWLLQDQYSIYLPSGNYVFVANVDEAIDKSLDQIDDQYKKNISVKDGDVTQDLNFEF